MAEQPTLVLMAGMPGAGKSTLALALSRALGWPAIDKDTLVSTLLTAGVPEPLAQSCAYDLLFALGRDLLGEQRLSVILDSPAGLPDIVERAAELVRAADARLKVVLCLAERDVRNRRVGGRAGKPSQPVARSTTKGDGRARFGHLPTDSLLVETTRPPNEVLREVVAYLRR